MSRLKAFLKTDGSGEISTIAFDQVQRKKIISTRYDSKQAAQKMYVRECLTHQNGSLVSLDLYLRKDKDWKKVGEAYSCPLCWKILKVEPSPEKWKYDAPVYLPVDESKLRKTTWSRKKSA